VVPEKQRVGCSGIFTFSAMKRIFFSNTNHHYCFLSIY
jgi:hypothetical protein